MSGFIKSWVSRGALALKTKYGSTAQEGTLFTKVDPAIDGEDCNQDCATCTVRYPSKFKIDEDTKLYGHVKGWSTHVLVATGKTDWVRDVEDEEGSVMEAIGKCHDKPTNGKLMLSASNIPLPAYAHDNAYPKHDEPTSVLLLPAFVIIDHVTPTSTPDLINHIISTAPTNASPILDSGKMNSSQSSGLYNESSLEESDDLESLEPTSLPADLPFKTRRCPHDVLVLMCSQRTRDVRCGQSAPLLKRELERHLRPLGLYRDDHDERPGGVGIYFISHVGGHKFSANVMIYRRSGIGQRTLSDGRLTLVNGEEGQITNDAKGEEGSKTSGEAAQCIWLARVKPEDCEGIVKYTILQGKVVKPESQLRGGFDREKGLVSW